jgi:hypothetical protein
MFTRVLELRTKSGKAHELSSALNEKILPPCCKDSQVS